MPTIDRLKREQIGRCMRPRVSTQMLWARSAAARFVSSSSVDAQVGEGCGERLGSIQPRRRWLSARPTIPVNAVGCVAVRLLDRCAIEPQDRRLPVAILCLYRTLGFFGGHASARCRRNAASWEPISRARPSTLVFRTDCSKAGQARHTAPDMDLVEPHCCVGECDLVTKMRAHAAKDRPYGATGSCRSPLRR